MLPVPVEVHALVFDFDGLILDTETADVVAWTAIFEAHGAVFPLAWWYTIVGRGADQNTSTPIDHLEMQVGREIDRPDIERAHRAEFLRLVAELEPIPGVIDRLDEARWLGIPCGVASSSHHAWVDPLLQSHGLMGRFTAVLCADDVAKAKPFPDLYLAASRALGAEPESALAFEDSRNGIAAAKAAGVWCVAVPNSVTRNMDLTAADFQIGSLADQTLDQLIASLSKR